MSAYFEKFTANGEASTINFYVALQGFLHMGFHIIDVNDPLHIPADDHESVVVGSINFIHQTLRQLGKTYPTELDYPPSLQSFLGRNIWSSTINQIDADASQWNVFVKPRGFSKKFTGRAIHKLSDLRGTGDQLYNTPI